MSGDGGSSAGLVICQQTQQIVSGASLQLHLLSVPGTLQLSSSTYSGVGALRELAWASTMVGVRVSTVLDRPNSITWPTDRSYCNPCMVIHGGAGLQDAVLCLPASGFVHGMCVISLMD